MPVSDLYFEGCIHSIMRNVCATRAPLRHIRRHPVARLAERAGIHHRYSTADCAGLSLAGQAIGFFPAGSVSSSPMRTRSTLRRRSS